MTAYLGCLARWMAPVIVTSAALLRSYSSAPISKGTALLVLGPAWTITLGEQPYPCCSLKLSEMRLNLAKTLLKKKYYEEQLLVFGCI